MVSETGLVEARGPDPSVQSAAAPPPNPLLLAHRALRGRYVVAVICAAVVGIAAAAAGWSLTKPKYASQGWIRAFPRQPRVLYETEENQVMPMFDAFVRSQAELLKSRRVVDLAISEPALRDAGWPGPPEGVQKMINAIDVAAQRGSELIGVTVSDESPQLAQAAANAVLNAFMQYQEEQEGLSATDREQRLRENQQLLNSELKTIRESIVRAADSFGGGDPDTLLAAKTEQLMRLDSILADPVLVLPSGAGPMSPRPADPELMSVEDLAQADSVLSALLAQRLAIEIDIGTANRSLGPDHREHAALRDRFDSVNAMIDKRAATARRALADRQIGLGGAPANDPAAVARHYKGLRDQAATDIRVLSLALMDIKSLRDREQEAERRLAETSQALNVIRVEDEIIRGGRVRIQQRAPTPIQPTTDRRIPLAAAGFIGGFGSVMAGFILVSIARRKLRYADELQSVDRLLPLIGVIPEVRHNESPEMSSIILSLHHIRNSLLLLRRPGRAGGTVYLVTSAVQGEGKTTVAIALGASFAQAGYRTTLVDGDLVGRGMTRELAVESRPGFVESLGASATIPLERSRIDGLSILPSGRCDGEFAHRLTLEGILPVIEDLRRQSDIVIIDTGPILGSLEVGLLAQLSDAVLLVAARGAGSRLVNAAIDRAGALTRGGVSLVFNRASSQDLTTSASYSSFTSRPEPAGHDRGRSDRGRLVRMLAPITDESHANGAP